MKTLQDILDLGLSVLIYTAEEDDVSHEPGPVRARAFKAPHRPGAKVGVGSGATADEALADLLSAPLKDLLALRDEVESP